ncbi:MAG: hypothetical protein ACREKG_05740 [Candidatus Rokuibacteriota bacterium]
MMPTVYTLQEVLKNQQTVSANTRAFCEKLLEQGDVLAVSLNYLPESLLWLVTTPAQVRLMRAIDYRVFVLTLGEAQDLLTAVGDSIPVTLYEVAECLAAPVQADPSCSRPDEDGSAEDSAI